MARRPGDRPGAAGHGARPPPTIRPPAPSTVQDPDEARSSHLGEVLVHVIELPADRRRRPGLGQVMGHRLPAVRFHSPAMAQHLEILGPSARSWRPDRRRRQRRRLVPHPPASGRPPPPPRADRCRGRPVWSGRCRSRGRTDVARRAGLLHLGRPMDDQRIAHAPATWVFCLQYHFSGVLPACAHPQGMLQWLLGPPMSSRRFHRLGDILGHAVEPLHLVEDATARPALLARPTLSDNRMKRVLSHRSMDLRKAVSRPICWCRLMRSSAWRKRRLPAGGRRISARRR